jgi:hypothetical protein
VELPKESIKLRKSLKSLSEPSHPLLILIFATSKIHTKNSVPLSLSLCPQRIGPNLPGYVRFHLEIKLAHALFQISISINLNNSHCRLKLACINLHHTNTCLEALQSGASNRIQIQLRNLTSKILSPPSPHLRFCNFQKSFRPGIQCLNLPGKGSRPPKSPNIFPPLSARMTRASLLLFLCETPPKGRKHLASQLLLLVAQLDKAVVAADRKEVEGVAQVAMVAIAIASSGVATKLPSLIRCEEGSLLCFPNI